MPEYLRKLPHFHPEGAYLFLTWRLWGSLLPPSADPPVYSSAGHAFVAQDRALERRPLGPLWLKDPRVADLVAHAILAGE